MWPLIDMAKAILTRFPLAYSYGLVWCFVWSLLLSPARTGEYSSSVVLMWYLPQVVGYNRWSVRSFSTCVAMVVILCPMLYVSVLLSDLYWVNRDSFLFCRLLGVDCISQEADTCIVRTAVFRIMMVKFWALAQFFCVRNPWLSSQFMKSKESLSD